MSARRWMALAVGGLTLVGLGVAIGRWSDSSSGAAAQRPSSADIGFAQAMTIHHQQAVLMSQLAPTSVDPPVGNVARSIEANQLQQVGQLQGWLQLWRAPLVPTTDPMAWMGEHHSMPGRPSSSATAMPGMATQAELDQLQAARGPQANVLFLQFMIRHHEGGVSMAHYEAAHGRLVQVMALAAGMVADETSEVQYMVSLLEHYRARPLPAPLLPATNGH